MNPRRSVAALRTTSLGVAPRHATSQQATVATNAPTRGFTLVELMVALTGGLFVSIVVFALARDGSRFYHRESRVAEATLGSVIGFDRLRNDIARAGYLSTPNIAADSRYCGSLAQLASFPRLQQMASIQVTADGAAAANSVLASATPPVRPNSILLSGAYNSLDRFDTIAVIPDATNTAVRLQTLRGALLRLNFSGRSTADQASLLAQLFPPRRALRLVSLDSGTFQVGVIASTGLDAVTGTPTIYLAQNPPLITSGPANTRCNASTNQQVNVVNFVRYSLATVNGANLNFPGYQQLFDATSNLNLPGEATRLELVREELDADGNTVTNSREVVAEYAVDLRFAITYVVNPTSTAPTLVTAPFDSANLLAFAGPVVPTNPTAQPQNIRSVRARLSVRSREADRDANVDTTAGNIAPGLYRIGLGPAGAKPFARVRTLQADTLIGSQSEQR